MSKVRQLIAARCEAWSICVLLVVRLIVAEPPTTTPPYGRAFGAGCPWAGSVSTSMTVACNAVPIIRLRRLRRTTPRTRTVFLRPAVAMRSSAVTDP
jgi:hypothetical protein